MWINETEAFELRAHLHNKHVLARVNVQGVESLWGDCRFIPADWGS